jgi:hypothetical protein
MEKNSNTKNALIATAEAASDFMHLSLPSWNDPILSEVDIPDLSSIHRSESINKPFSFNIERNETLYWEDDDRKWGDVGDHLIALLLGFDKAPTSQQHHVQLPPFHNDDEDIIGHEDGKDMEIEDDCTEDAGCGYFDHSEWTNEQCAEEEDEEDDDEDICYEEEDSSEMSGSSVEGGYDSDEKGDIENTKLRDDIDNDEIAGDSDCDSCGVVYAWLIDANYNVADGLTFKLHTEGGAYMKLCADEVIDSVKFLISDSDDPSMKFLVKSVDNRFSIVDSTKVVDLLEAILRDKPSCQTQQLGTMVKTRDDSGDFFLDDDLSIFEEMEYRTMPAVVSPGPADVPTSIKFSNAEVDLATDQKCGSALTVMSLTAPSKKRRCYSSLSVK